MRGIWRDYGDCIRSSKSFDPPNGLEVACQINLRLAGCDASWDLPFDVTHMPLRNAQFLSALGTISREMQAKHATDYAENTVMTGALASKWTIYIQASWKAGPPVGRQLLISNCHLHAVNCTLSSSTNTCYTTTYRLHQLYPKRPLSEPIRDKTERYAQARPTSISASRFLRA